MLSRELMGILALGILWVNTLLVMGAAWREVAALRARGRLLRPLPPGEPGAGLVEGEVVSAPGGVFASHEVDQVGRQASDDRDRRAITFSDRAFRGAVMGGAVRAGEVEIAVPAAPDAEVWVAPATLAACAACPGEEGFASAYDDARKARGFSRTVTAPVACGDRIWIAGEARRGEDGRMSIHAIEGAKLLVSAVDPRAVCARYTRLLALFLIGVPAAAALCTALALYPPHFGLVSTVGGALALAYFLLVQPAGTAVRDAVLLPHRRFLRGSWVSEGGSSAPARAGGARRDDRPEPPAGSARAEAAPLQG